MRTARRLTAAFLPLGAALLLLPLAAARGEERTPLAELAERLPPGAWAELPTEGLDASILKAPQPSKGLDILGWTDDACWDGRTGQFLFMGLRQRRRFIAYRESENRWRNIPLPEDHEAAGSPPIESRFGHVYSRNAHDAARGRFYHMDHNGGGICRYDLATGRWTRLPHGGNHAMTGVIEYFPELGGLVNLGSGKEGVWLFEEEKQQWKNLGPVAVHGYHSLGRYNGVRREVLLAGGNESRRVTARVRADGTLERLADAPADLTIRHDKIAAAPGSGRYLLLLCEERQLWEFDSETNRYHLRDDFQTTPWPFGPYDMPVAATLPEHGVVMWLAGKVMLYKPVE